MTDRPYTGGCLCRATRYEISQAPILAYTCHCTDCQHLTGGAFGIGVVVAEAAFRLTGQTQVLESRADSGRVKRRHVCAVCGVWVCGDPHRGRSEMIRVIRGGTFDTIEWLRPTTHFWLRSKQPWIVLPAGDQYFDTQPDDPADVRVPPWTPFEWSELIGRRIRLLAMPNDPAPIPVGMTGTVESVSAVVPNFTQISVNWDNGRRLMLSVPPDGFQVIA